MNPGPPTPGPAGSESPSLWTELQARSRAVWDRPAVRFEGAELSFRELYRAADRIAQELLRAGLSEGSFVAYAGGSSLSFVPTVLGLWRLGATVGLLSPKYGFSELGSIVRGARPAALLVPSSSAVEWGKWLGWRVERVEGPVAGDSLGLLLPPWEGSAFLPAALVKFTSGSTAEPKGVALTALNVMAEAGSVRRTLELRPGDRILAPVPLFHSYGFDLGVLAMLFSGATLVLPHVFIPRRLIADLAERQASVFLGVPSIYRALVDTPLSNAPDLSPVRYLLSCTAPLPPALISAFSNRFKAPICQHYGSSEAGAVTTHVPSVVAERLDSVGRAQDGVSLSIVGEGGLELPAGSEGEVVVRSPAVASGYLMGASDPPVLVDGTCRMGDLGVMDVDGFLVLRGRQDQLINVGGLKVSPLEVAHVLEQHPWVKEAAVVGVRTGNAGEEVVYGVVTLRHPGREDQLLEWCRGQLAEHKVPRRIDIRDELPRGATGKVRLMSADVHL